MCSCLHTIVTLGLMFVKRCMHSKLSGEYMADVELVVAGILGVSQHLCETEGLVIEASCMPSGFWP